STTRAWPNCCSLISAMFTYPFPGQKQGRNGAALAHLLAHYQGEQVVEIAGHYFDGFGFVTGQALGIEIPRQYDVNSVFHVSGRQIEALEQLQAAGAVADLLLEFAVGGLQGGLALIYGALG